MPSSARSAGVKRLAMVAGWVRRVSGPPRDRAMRASRQRSITAIVSSAVPSTSKVTTVPPLRHLPLGEVVLRVALEERVRHRADPRVRLERRRDRQRRCRLLPRPARAACGCRARRSTRRTATPGCRAPTGTPRSGSMTSALPGDHAEQAVVVAGDALGGGVQHQVDAVVERPLHDGAGEGGVDHGDRSGDRRRWRRGRRARARGWPGVSTNTTCVRPGITAAAISSASVPSTNVTSMPRRGRWNVNRA